MKHLLVTALVFTLPASLCLAGKAADLQPTLAKPGRVLVEDNFSGSEPGKLWTTPKGDWHPQNGAMVGKEKAADNHPAVLLLGQPIRNSILRFSFKLDGAKAFAVSLNSAKGHLFRIQVENDGLVILKDKDKKNPASKSEELGKAAGKFAPGEWYTMQVEILGSKVAVQTDNGVKVSGGHPELDVDKIGYRFVTRGESLLLSDLKVWEARP
jgi:hypothetical protein